MNIKIGLLNSVVRQCCKMSTLHPSKEKPMDEIKNHLRKFPGGSVDLIKNDDGLAIVVLNHDEKKNAMSGNMMVDLCDVIENLNTWSAGKGVILRGSNGNFCSGGDLDFVKRTATPEDGFMMSTFMQNILNKFQRLPMISVALVEGIGALGGGSELTVACDFILISEACKGIGFVQGKMGIPPAWGGTNRLVAKVGYTKALELLLTSKLVSPRECVDIGLVNDIIPANEDCESFALSWLRKRTQFDVGLIRCLKTSVVNAINSPRDYETERRLFAPFWGGDAHREALEKNIKHRPES